MILGFSIGFLDFGLLDVIDIALVTFLLYQLYKLVRGSVAVKVFIGFSLIYLLYLVVRAADMELLGSILGQFIGVGVIAAVILFQQEIRKFLLLIGQSTELRNEKLQRWLPISRSTKGDHTEINIAVKAAKELSEERTGALMVFGKSSNLQSYVDSGDLIDAVVSKRLLLSIFNKYSPLHDGAVIIRSGRILAARCIIPVSDNQELPANFGLRHRAAIGLTEITDCAVIIVSEETGAISLAWDGQIKHGLSTAEIRNDLTLHLYPEVSKKIDKLKKGEIKESPAAGV